jgi:fumarate reductase flavoprotein subunit
MKPIRSKMGRRRFLLTAAATSTSALAYGKLAGLASQDAQNVYAMAAGTNAAAGVERASTGNYAKTITTDVVVVGSGAGGMTAAIRAKQQGVKNVLILEKRAEPGGNSVFAPIPMKRDAKTSKEQIFKAAMESTGWRGDPRVIGTMIDKSEEIADWLEGFAGEDAQGGVYDGKLVKLLRGQCERLGIQIVCDTRAKKLLKKEDNAVYAVVAEQNGKEIKVEATSTVLATGGFLGDPEFMKKYFPIYDDSFSQEVNSEGLLYTGDGIRMALEAGAGDDGTISFAWSSNKMPFFKGDLKKFPTVSILTDNTRTPALWVNNVGVRFTNEPEANATNAIYRQPNKSCFIMIDAGTVEYMAGKFPGLVSMERLQQEIPTLIDADQALVTDSVGAIAAWIGGKRHILQNHVDSYNKCCDKGFDDLFYRDAAVLVPLKKPPFYVFRSGLALRNTHGPLKISGMGSIVSKWDWPIPALMACGADIGGLHANLLISGGESHSIEWTIASGLRAGENAAAYMSGNRPVQVFAFPKYTAKEVMAGHYKNTGELPAGTAGPPSGPGTSAQPDNGTKYH